MKQNDQNSSHHLFAIRDLDSKGYGLPAPAESTAHFLRDLARATKNPDHLFNQYGSRFEIFEIGGYDYTTGIVIPQSPRYVGLVSDLLPGAQDNGNPITN